MKTYKQFINEFVKNDDIRYWALYYHIYDNYFSKLYNREEIQELRKQLIDEFDNELIPIIDFFADYRLKKLDI